MPFAAWAFWRANNLDAPPVAGVVVVCAGAVCVSVVGVAAASCVVVAAAGTAALVFAASSDESPHATTVTVPMTNAALTSNGRIRE